MILVIGNIIALIASIFMVYSGIIKNKKKILYIQSIQIGLFVLSNLVLGGIPGAIINFVSFIRNILCYENKLELKEKILITIISIVFVLYFNNLGLIGLLPLVSMIIYIWFMTIKDVIKFKILIMITIVLWCIYDFSIGSYTSFIFDVFTIITNTISIIKIKKININNIKTPEELLYFMSTNINYGYLGKNGKIYHFDDPDFNSDWYEQSILQSKEELLKNLYGNCFDQVEFERDWFLKNKYEIKTIYEMIKLDYDNEYPTHSFLVYKEGNYYYWFENADFDNRGIHRFNSYNELLIYQYHKYVEYLKTFNISDDELDKIIITEFNKPKDHISVEEYLKHVTNSKIININNENKINIK